MAAAEGVKVTMEKTESDPNNNKRECTGQHEESSGSKKQKLDHANTCGSASVEENTERIQPEGKLCDGRQLVEVIELHEDASETVVFLIPEDLIDQKGHENLSALSRTTDKDSSEWAWWLEASENRYGDFKKPFCEICSGLRGVSVVYHIAGFD